MRYRFVFFLLTLWLAGWLFPFQARSQTGNVRGFVYEKETGEPVIFCNVYLYRTTYGSPTDVNGYFAITQVPTGTYTLMISYLGYDTLRMPVTLKSGDVLTYKLFLQKAVYQLEGVSISAERQDVKVETRTSVVKITPKQIKQIPTIGGQADLAQYLQVLPGVIFTGDQGGQLYIRGGSPVQNKVLLDGMIIYNPFHSIGLFSVFDPDIFRNADVYTGGFGAEYGGRISSVMDITTRDGNKKEITGKADLSTFGAKLMVEGPLKKQTETGEGSSSFILTAKNSYLKESSKLFYDYIDTAGLPFNFADIYGKVSFNSTNGSKVNFFGFNFTDKVNYKAVSDFKWTSSGGGTNFVVIPGKSPMLFEGNFAYSTYNISIMDKTSLPKSSEVNGFNMGLKFTYFYGKDELKYGLEMLGFKTNFQFFNQLNRLIDQTQNTTELGGFLKYKMVRGKFLIEPSFRLQWYASLSNISPEPRLAVKYNAFNKLRFKLAGGWYSQNLLTATSDRDVVNLFYGFLSGPENLQSTFNGKEVTHKLQKAQHIIVGMEFEPSNNITMNLEGYYKNFSQLTNLNRNKVFEDNADYSDKPDYYKKDFIIENGFADGVDFSIKYEYHRYYFWGVYSLAYTEHYDGKIRYNPHYDRRHNVNLLAAVTLGQNLDWEVNTRWNFGSGFPFTQTQGIYEQLNFNGGINTNYWEENGGLGYEYAALNKGRLPTYHRLDLTVKKKFEFSRSKLEVNLSLTNVYNRKNIFYVDRTTGEKVYQLPFMPSLGLNLTF